VIKYLSERVDIGYEFCPLSGEHRFKQMILLLLVNAWVGDSVERNLLEVSDAELPRKSSVRVVKRDTSVVEEARVVAADRELQTTVDQVSDWVCPKIEGVAENHVAKRANFDTNIFIDILLNKIREKE